MTAGLETNTNLRRYAVGLTDVGRVRDENQDAFFTDENLGVFAVMDGAGGLKDGAVASGLVKEALAAIARPKDAEDLFNQFETHVIKAKERIEQAAAQANGSMMGTTIAALLTYGSHFVCLWAGDSRVYRYRQGRLEQLTTDHTEAQELVDKNVLSADEAKSYPRRHVITRAIGSGLDLELDVVSGSLQPADRFMLCSDGLTGHLEDAVIATLLMNGAARASAKDLVNGALENGGSDNVTVVIVDIDRTSTAGLEARQ